MWWLVGDRAWGIRFWTCARVLLLCVLCVCACVCFWGCSRALKKKKKKKNRQLRAGPCVVSRPGAHLGTARSCRYGAELAQKRYVLPTV